MPNVMPSQVVLVIEKFFPHVSRGDNGEILAQHLDRLQGIVNLIREIPPELINVPADQYADLVLAMATIEENQKVRIARGGGDFGVSHLKGSDVASVLYRVLAQCPDEFPPAQAYELLFVNDDNLRENIRRDISAINRAIEHFDWKAATVLAGAAIEALLLWRLSEQPTDAEIDKAISSRIAKGGFARPKGDLVPGITGPRNKA